MADTSFLINSTLPINDYLPHLVSRGTVNHIHWPQNKKTRVVFCHFTFHLNQTTQNCAYNNSAAQQSSEMSATVDAASLSRCRFNRLKNPLKNPLRFQFESVTCLNYPFFESSQYRKSIEKSIDFSNELDGKLNGFLKRLLNRHPADRQSVSESVPIWTSSS